MKSGRRADVCLGSVFAAAWTSMCVNSVKDNVSCWSHSLETNALKRVACSGVGIAYFGSWVVDGLSDLSLKEHRARSGKWSLDTLAVMSLSQFCMPFFHLCGIRK